MITIVKNSEADSEKVPYITTPIEDRLNDFDFSNVVVKKPWGYEYLMYQNNNVSIWILHIKYSHLTSMHCHINKKTALLILSGKAITTTLEQGFNLKEGDGLLIDKKVFHSTQSTSNEGTILMEIETPSQKTDLLRLSDNYEREFEGYESEEHISSDLSQYEYISFKENEFDTIKRIKNMALFIEKFENEQKIIKSLTNNMNNIGVILNGRLNNWIKGDIFHADNIINNINSVMPLEILWLKNNGNC